MPSPDLLESAGQRAAFRPVPIPPSVDELTAEVDRRRTNRRRAIGGGIAALALVVGLPLGASLIGGDQPDDVVTFAADGVAGDSIGEGAVAVQPAETSTSTSTTTTPEDSDADADLGPFAGIDEENFDLSLNFGDTSFSIAVITGGDAAERAAAAEAAADSTRTVDDETVWLDEQGDETTASAFFDGETFVSVTGPTSDIDQVLDLVTEHADGPMQFFDLKDFSEDFDIPEGVFDDNFELDLDGDGLPEDFDTFFDGDGLPEDFDTFFDGLPGVDDAAMEDFRQEMEEFSECMQVELDRSGDSLTIEIPDCDLPGLEGVITPGLNKFFDGEGVDSFFDDRLLEDLFDEGELDDLLDDAFGDAEDALKDAEDALKDAEDALEDAS